MFSEADIQAIARFVIGFGTEQDEVWRDYNLDFAGRIEYRDDGMPLVFRPIGQSGYSLGSLQWDFGQQPSLAVPFVDAFEHWIAKHPREPTLKNDPEFVGRALGLTGGKLAAHPSLGLNRQDVSALSSFVRTDDGSDWVNENIDVNLIGSDARKRVVVKGKEYDKSLTAVAREVEATVAFQAFSQAGDAGAMRLVYAVGMKTYNQSPGSFSRKLRPFLSAKRTFKEVAEWSSGLSGGLKSGVGAATRLSTFWADWMSKNKGKLRDDLQRTMTGSSLSNPVATSKSSGIYVLSKQVFENTPLFNGFSDAMETKQDFVSKALFVSATGAIRSDPRTNRLHPGMLAYKGRQYVWNAAGNAFRYDVDTWKPVPTKQINIKKL